KQRRTIVKRTTIYLFVLGALVAFVVSAGLVVSAQNSNSSMTMENTNKPKPKPRRHRPKPKTTEAAADTGAMAEATPTPAMKRTGRCDPSQQEQTDLFGTYTGKLKHGDEAAMEVTLTITGNNFTMTSVSD